jgi:CRP-like cAMP-binding protein
MTMRDSWNQLQHTGKTNAFIRDNATRQREITQALGEDVPTPLQSLLGQARSVTWQPHDTLYHQGSPADTVIFIAGGIVKLVSHLANGRARIVRLHRSGSVLGLNGLLTEDNKHTAVAVTPVSALHLPLSAVQSLRRDDPGTYVRLIECWNGYLEDADTWITQFSTGPIRGRVARLLIFLLEFDREIASGDVQLLTCEEMGSILGVTCESTSRILAAFKRQRILAGHDDQAHELYEADIPRLRAIAEEE